MAEKRSPFDTRGKLVSDGLKPEVSVEFMIALRYDLAELTHRYESLLAFVHTIMRVPDRRTDVVEAAKVWARLWVDVEPDVGMPEILALLKAVEGLERAEAAERAVVTAGFAGAAD